MRSLLLFLAISFIHVVHAAPMQCSRLKEIAFELEKNIQTKNFGKDCDKINAKSLGLPDGFVGFDGGEDDYRCKDFSAIELRLKSIENEIALLNGIKALKDEIQTGKLTIEKYKEKPTLAQDASQSLMSNLQIAYSLELLLATNNDKGENILSHIVADKNGWTDLNSFRGLVKTYCAKGFKQAGANICQKKFEITEDVYKEINDFASIGGKTDKKFNKKHIEDLSEALAIEKDGQMISYGDLLVELQGINEDGLLSDTDREKIKVWPDLSSSNKYDFIKNLKSAKKDLSDAEELIKVQNIPSRYSSLFSDLKKRQEWDHKSKLSLILFQYGKKIPAEAASACEKARNLEGKIEDCLDPLMKAVGDGTLDKTIIDNIKSELQYGDKHLNKLDDISKKCVPDASLNLPAECESLITTDLAKLLDKAQYLTALKAKMFQPSPDLVEMRNFAMEKLLSGKCMKNSQDTNITGCEADLGPISKTATALVGDAQDILFVLQNSDEVTPIDEICDESEEKVFGKEELCALRDDEAKNKSKTNNADTYEAPDEPDFQRNNNGDAWGQALMNIGQGIGSYFTPQQSYFNPYASMYPVTTPYAGPMDISSKIMYPAIMGGYGNYYPTQGLAPYGGGYAASYGFSTSSYFNYSVGH